MKAPIVPAVLFRLYIKPGYSPQLSKLIEAVVERAVQEPSELTALKLKLQQRRCFFVPAGAVISIPVLAACAVGYFHRLTEDRSKRTELRMAAFSLLAGAAGDDKSLLVELAAGFQERREDPALRKFAYEIIRQRQGSLRNYGKNLLTQLAGEGDPDLAALLLELVFLADPALLPGPAEKQEYWSALLSFPHRKLFQTALRVLGRFEAAATNFAVPLSERLSQETDAFSKQLLIDALSRIITSQSQASVPIGFCLRERNVHVSIAAYNALLRLGPKAAAVMPLLTLEMLAKAESRRQRALDLMAAIGAPQPPAGAAGQSAIDCIALLALAGIGLSDAGNKTAPLSLIGAAAARLQLVKLSCLDLRLKLFRPARYRLNPGAV